MVLTPRDINAVAVGGILLGGFAELPIAALSLASSSLSTISINLSSSHSSPLTSWLRISRNSCGNLLVSIDCHRNLEEHLEPSSL